MRRQTKSRRKHSNVLVGVAIVVIVVALAAFLKFRGNDTKAKNTEDDAKIAQLKLEIESEQERATELEEYAKYVKTKQFAEIVARNKLGLVYPNELVFAPEDK